uniref:Uncharacterized protein n=1 Tax=Panagrolaimus davidi TaxID=227884 RepID=A0A914QWV9_9BILA
MPVPFYLRYLVLCRKMSPEIVYSKKMFYAYFPVFFAFALTYIGLFWCYPPFAEHHLEFIEPLNTEFWLNEYGEIPLFAATKIAILPFTVGQLPVIVLFILIFTKTENNNLTIIFSGIMAWVPLVNPIAAIFIIGPYRKRIFSWIKFKQQQSVLSVTENNLVGTGNAGIYSTNVNTYNTLG